jgi:hydroxyacylglutathione hydrolase
MAAMIVESSSNPQFVSNTYLVSDGQGGPAFFIDAGGPVAPLIEAAERRGLTPTHVLLTHHHFDHVCDIALLRKRWPKIEVLISPIEGELMRGDLVAAAAEGKAPEPDVTTTVEAGQTLQFGGLEVCPLHTPGHTAGMLSFLVGERAAGTTPGAGAGRPAKRAPSSAAPGGFTGGEAAVFTGDTLFKNSVGGVKAPGHTTYTDLRDSIMGTLMELPPETVIYPGHSSATTVAQEWDTNSFIRVWRGLDPQGSEPCLALGEPATLVLLGEDYDGGTKAWIRWADGKDDIVPGSRIERIA